MKKLTALILALALSLTFVSALAETAFTTIEPGKITYATSPNERYKITYSPRKSTILENHGNDAYGFDYLPYSYPTDRSTDLEAFFRDRGEDAPKDFSGLYLHRYEEDEPIYGEYTDGTINLVSGSGDYLKYWFEEGHGARVYRRLYPCTYFKSPRYK